MGVGRFARWANSQTVMQIVIKVLNVAVRLAPMRAASPSTVKAVAKPNKSAMRGKIAGSVIWSKTGCMKLLVSNVTRKVGVAVAARPVIALQPVPIVRSYLFLLGFAGFTSCLPSKPAPKGDKSRDNDLAFRPTDLSFKRPSPPSKGASDAGVMTTAGVHSHQILQRPDQVPLSQPFFDH